MKNQLIVITGGPSTGKTTLIEKLIQKGYHCFSEISRQITLDAKKQGIDQLFLEQPLLFSQLILDGRKKQYDEAKCIDKNLVFLDRGLPDVLAYMRYIGDEIPTTFTATCIENQYDKIFLLPPWEEIYTQDEARYENYEESVQIYSHLKKTYESFGYKIIEVPIDTIENRIDFIENHL